MSNPWVSHVKQYAAANKMTYGCAMSDSSCKAAYKKEPSKESKKTKESKESKESKEIKDTKVYTMYSKPIGPVKPTAPKKQEKKPASYYKDMIAMALKDHVEPKIKIKIPKK
jgi:hypothetical protein